MSNNRMWLVHRVTGDRLLLAKYSGCEWWRYHDDLADKMDAFFENDENSSEAFRFREGAAYALEFEVEPVGPPEEALVSIRAEYQESRREKASS